MDISKLAEDLIAAKRDEAIATLKRIAIEDEIIKALGAREEGSSSHTLPSGTKLVITGKLSYSVTDMPTFLELCQKLPEELRPIKTETKIDETVAKKLRAENKELWSVVAPAITTKPAKTGVQVRY
ncbi:hypothetical protein EBT16_04695 [bacterium]|nr:hypothetical protein [bacterium]